MTISATDVNRLRQQTGAGMMDCKKALTEAEGDFEKAVEILRLKGQKVSASRQDRDAKEGAVFARVAADGSYGIIFQLSSETDFVARNDSFQQLGDSILTLALAAKPATLDALLALPMDGRTVADILTDAMGKIGEKIEIGRYELLNGQQVSSYIHTGGKVGVLVSFNGTDGVNVEQVGKDVCMQIAAMKPIALSKDQISQDTLDKELEIARTTALQDGKPEAMIDKIAQGYLQKFLKENTLLAQEFVKDPSKTIEKYIKEQGSNLQILDFKRLHLG